jgi:hypothetical protein
MPQVGGVNASLRWRYRPERALAGVGESGEASDCGKWSFRDAVSHCTPTPMINRIAAIRRATQLFAVLLLVPAVARAQAAKPMEHTHGDKHAPSAWKELDRYHTLMAAAWHPARDKSDLAPARTTAAEMATAAKALTTTTPKACAAHSGYADKVTALATETDKVAAMVAKQAADAELKAALKALHDTFHGVEEGCSAEKMKKND